LPFRCLKVRNIKERAKKKKKSLQDMAREVRYYFFQKLVHREKAWGAAVAHHRDDQAETVMDRLLRGAGARGLSGLRSLQAMNFSGKLKPLRVWRPLLPYSKEEIQGYLKKNGIRWREDGTNAESLYRRNQIRREIIPFLSRWNPNLIQTLARIAEVNLAEDQYLESLLVLLERRVRSLWAHESYSCDAGIFRKTALALQRRWVRHVCEKLEPGARGLSFDRIEEIIRLWEGREKGPRDLGFGLVAGRTGNRAFSRRKGA
jgi:tRNA(Ile)-lysidine synthase